MHIVKAKGDAKLLAQDNRKRLGLLTDVGALVIKPFDGLFLEQGSASRLVGARFG